MVIAQCYQMGPVQKIDPLGLIAEAKRVCDNLVSRPSFYPFVQGKLIYAWMINFNVLFSLQTLHNWSEQSLPQCTLNMAKCHHPHHRQLQLQPVLPR